MFTSFSSFSSMQNTYNTSPPVVSRGYTIISDTEYDYYVFTSTTPLIAGQPYTGVLDYNFSTSTTINTLAVSGGCPGCQGYGIATRFIGGAGGRVVSSTRTLNGTNTIQVTVGLEGEINVRNAQQSSINFVDGNIPVINTGVNNGGGAGGGTNVNRDGSQGTYPTGLPLFNGFRYGACGGMGGLYSVQNNGGSGGLNGGGGGGSYKSNTNNYFAPGGGGATNGPATINSGNPGIVSNTYGSGGGAAGANTGGGGGGGASNSTTSGANGGTSGKGGSGIVVIAFPK